MDLEPHFYFLFFIITNICQAPGDAASPQSIELNFLRVIFAFLDPNDDYWSPAQLKPILIRIRIPNAGFEPLLILHRIVSADGRVVKSHYAVTCTGRSGFQITLFINAFRYRFSAVALEVSSLKCL